MQTLPKKDASNKANVIFMSDLWILDIGNINGFDPKRQKYWYVSAAVDVFIGVGGTDS